VIGDRKSGTVGVLRYDHFEDLLVLVQGDVLIAVI
jgi:hypothetical protein